MPENSFGKRQPGDQSVPLKESSGKPSGKGKDPLSQMAGLTLPQKIACLWPLILIFVGGFIGGACGGGACAINIQIMRGSLPGPAKYALAVLTGIGAFVAYLLIVLVLALMFPGIFGPGA
ncbi:hypothetical protein ACFOOP_06005 [Marinicaulis aureus]|uniref:DUF4190 domain-containing protein n=1 Tax=Hyphococcus aureus TaxID=2666033 RepID=A0ABW1KS17_9PROT